MSAWWFAPTYLVPSVQSDPTNPNKRLELESKARETVGQALVGLGAIIGLGYAFLNARAATRNAEAALQNAVVAGERLTTERFAGAIELLGSDKIEVRLGGIYALERIARDAQQARGAHKQEHGTIIEVLCAFIRERAPWKEEEAGSRWRRRRRRQLPVRSSPPATDVQAALDVLGRRTRTDGEPPLDLRLTDLRRAGLARVDLRGAYLWGAHLEGAYLYGGTHLEGANLEGADLEGADLWGAYLCQANLRRVNLRAANLTGADLSGADLTGANLDQTKLGNTLLSKAILNGATLTGADLGQAQGLTQEQIDRIRGWNRETKLPERLFLPKREQPDESG